MFAELRPYKITDKGIELQVKVTPKASKNRIGEVFTDSDGINILRIYVTAVPEDGKANKAVIELLAKALGVSKSSLEITRGHTDQRKTILISDVSVENQLKLIA